MLDYYGSIKIPKKRIYSEMISYFKDYKKDYIHSILDLFIKEGIFFKDYSYSGYQMFHRNTIIDRINEKIQNDYNRNYRKLKFIYASTKNKDLFKLPYDILELILLKINNIYIIND